MVTPFPKIMDGRHWDRIADLLVQIRKKYAELDPKLDENKEKRKNALDNIHQLLELNDLMAEMDAKGWL